MNTAGPQGPTLVCAILAVVVLGFGMALALLFFMAIAGALFQWTPPH